MWKRWRSHNSIRYIRKPNAARTFYGSMCHRSDRSSTLQEEWFWTFCSRDLHLDPWRPHDFFNGWAMRGLKDGSPQRVPGAVRRWRSGLRPHPEADKIFSKWCINTSSTETLGNMCSTKSTSQHLQRRQVPPPFLAHACGRPHLGPMTFIYELDPYSLEIYHHRRSQGVQWVCKCTPRTRSAPPAKARVNF